MGLAQITNRFEDLPKLEKLPPGREWVYFLEGSFPDKLIKIGHSVDLKRRLIQLQTTIPVQLSLIGAVNAPAGSEFVLHRIFEADRTHCEWFIPSENLLKAIRSLPKAGKIDGVDLLEIGKPYGLDEKTLRVLFWSGIRRVGRGMRVPGESQRKRPLEKLILEGFRY